MINTVNIEKDYIQFGDTKVCPPFSREEVDAVLGIPEITEKDIQIDTDRFVHQVTYFWNSLGIISTAEKLTDRYTNFIVYLDRINTDVRKIDVFFSGQVQIRGRNYTEESFKPDQYGMCHEKKIGPFTVNTVLADRIGELDSRSLAEWMSKEVEITYKAPRPKTSVYDLRKPNEPVLKFDSFPFKLMVMEELMYKKGSLKPRFDIYDYAEKNPKREIDVDSEGYAPVPEAKKWFKDYPVPARLAAEITELTWDGGLEVFTQIYPFWDGEDDCFDVKKLTAEEVRQFPGLKKVHTGTGFSKKAIAVLKGLGIEADA